MRFLESSMMKMLKMMTVVVAVSYGPVLQVHAFARTSIPSTSTSSCLHMVMRASDHAYHNHVNGLPLSQLQQELESYGIPTGGLQQMVQALHQARRDERKRVSEQAVNRFHTSGSHGSSGGTSSNSRSGGPTSRVRTTAARAQPPHQHQQQQQQQQYHHQQQQPPQQQYQQPPPPPPPPQPRPPRTTTASIRNDRSTHVANEIQSRQTQRSTPPPQATSTTARPPPTNHNYNHNHNNNHKEMLGGNEEAPAGVRYNTHYRPPVQPQQVPPSNLHEVLHDLEADPELYVRNQPPPPPQYWKSFEKEHPPPPPPVDELITEIPHHRDVGRKPLVEDLFRTPYYPHQSQEDDEPPHGAPGGSSRMGVSEQLFQSSGYGPAYASSSSSSRSTQQPQQQKRYQARPSPRARQQPPQEQQQQRYQASTTAAPPPQPQRAKSKQQQWNGPFPHAKPPPAATSTTTTTSSNTQQFYKRKPHDLKSPVGTIRDNVAPPDAYSSYQHHHQQHHRSKTPLEELVEAVQVEVDMVIQDGLYEAPESYVQKTYNGQPVGSSSSTTNKNRHLHVGCGNPFPSGNNHIADTIKENMNNSHNKNTQAPSYSSVSTAPADIGSAQRNHHHPPPPMDFMDAIIEEESHTLEP